MVVVITKKAKVVTKQSLCSYFDTRGRYVGDGEAPGLLGATLHAPEKPQPQGSLLGADSG